MCMRTKFFFCVSRIDVDTIKYTFKHNSIISKDHIKKIPHVLVHSILYRPVGNGTLSQTPLSETRKIITHKNCDYRMYRNILDGIFMLVQDVLCVI